MQYTETEEMGSVHFDSVGELLDFDINSYKTVKSNKSLFDRSKNEGLKAKDLSSGANLGDWYGVGRTTPQQVIRDAIIGWKKGYEIAVEWASELGLDAQIMPCLQNKTTSKRKRIKCDFGDELDIHSIYQGKTEAWSKMERIKVDEKHKLYTIFIDVGSKFSVNANDTIWTAAAVYLVTKDLISLGKSVKVIIGTSAKNLVHEKKIITTDIVVKNYNEPLSIEKLVGMSNAGFHRVFNFMARCLTPYKASKFMGASTKDLKEKQTVEIAKEIKAGNMKFIYIPMCTTKYAAESAILELGIKEKAHTAARSA